MSVHTLRTTLTVLLFAVATPVMAQNGGRMPDEALRLFTIISNLNIAMATSEDLVEGLKLSTQMIEAAGKLASVEGTTPDAQAAATNMRKQFVQRQDSMVIAALQEAGKAEDEYLRIEQGDHVRRLARLERANAIYETIITSGNAMAAAPAVLEKMTNEKNAVMHFAEVERQALATEHSQALPAEPPVTGPEMVPPRQELIVPPPPPAPPSPPVETDAGSESAAGRVWRGMRNLFTGALACIVLIIVGNIVVLLVRAMRWMTGSARTGEGADKTRTAEPKPQSLRGWLIRWLGGSSDQ